MLHTKIYSNIEEFIRNQSANLKIEQFTTSDKIRNAIRWIMRNNPDIFWFGHQYHYDEACSTIHFQYTFSFLHSLIV